MTTNSTGLIGVFPNSPELFLLVRFSIPDPTALKPLNWNKGIPEYIGNPNARMPVGWLEDEPWLIADATAERPEDWSDELHGFWEPPFIRTAPIIHKDKAP